MEPTIDRDHDTSADASTDRYGLLETGTDEWLVYDRERPTAWVQADTAVEVTR